MELFATLNKQLADYDAEIWEPLVHLSRYAYLKQAHEKDTHIYFIEKGGMRIFIETPEEDITYRLGYAGNVFGDLQGFISDTPTAYCIQALRQTVLKPVRRERFLAFLEADEKHKSLWFDLLNSVILQQGERERDLLTGSPTERYRRVLARSPQLFQEIPLKYIASYLRMSPETLSRIRNS
ncbi:Crp/Fnr family transcriptional regulator [Sediminicola luteus]|uniref:Cyclic nucleotide-binding domain-containing protein n=1 Tax=Sediminicola luteus TaxID=319238 RepID=A0A2A4G251_9FLAO|nr:cyclic nucleotide-binding domain-containing protein [Sediminicola luteus]PCE62757.1 hypothetical protein B7P33_15830 [Sediminicola luteus]